MLNLMRAAVTAEKPLSQAVLEAAHPIVLTLAGGGCSPKVYDAVFPPELACSSFDWTAGDGPFDPLAIANRLGGALCGRRGKTVLAGHSIGGFIALLVAIHFPGQVHALILSNTGARVEGHGDPGLPTRIRKQWDARAQADFLRSCFDCNPPQALWDEMVAYMANLPTDTLLQAVTGLRELDASAELGRVICPTLVAHGQRDRRRPLESATQMAEGIAGAKLALLPGGHTPMVDCPVAYRRVVEEFLVAAGFIPLFNTKETS